MKTCIKCFKSLLESEFYRESASKDGLKSICKQCKNRQGKEWYQNNRDAELRRSRQYRENNSLLIKERQTSRRKKLKERVFQEYGGPWCACCGETNLYFLSIDHIDNNGAEERRILFGKSTTGLNFYEWLSKNKFPNKDKYQVLCMNCNFGKARNNGICPHKEKNR
jgi:hypothetical protein